MTPEEDERYARQTVLPGFGAAGQQRLKDTRVLVVGAGGLGSPCLTSLAVAGIGTIGVADDDRVSLSNLARQTIHETSAVGRPKVESASEAIARLNPHVRVKTHPLRMSSANAAEIVSRYDLVADGTDSFASRFALPKPAKLPAVRWSARPSRVSRAA